LMRWLLTVYGAMVQATSYTARLTVPSAALVISDPGRWGACWVSGTELVSDADMHSF
jgi:hypothetical protein